MPREKNAAPDLLSETRHAAREQSGHPLLEIAESLMPPLFLNHTVGPFCGHACLHSNMTASNDSSPSPKEVSVAWVLRTVPLRLLLPALEGSR